MNRILKLIIVLLFACSPALAQTVISAVYVSATTATTATIVWTTSTPATSKIRYGFDNTLPFANNQNFTLSTSHSMTLTVLTPAQPYFFAVVSVDGSGNSTQSSTFQFALCGQPIVPVSGTVNFAYANGTYTMTWNPPSGAVGSPTVCGLPVTTTVTGTINTSGSFTSLVADAMKVTPGPGTWTIAVNGAGAIGGISVQAPLSVTNQDISGQLQTAAVPVNLQTVTATATVCNPAWVCVGSGSVISPGQNYLFPIYNLTTGKVIGPSNIGSDATGNNLFFPTGGTVTIPGCTGKVVAADGTGCITAGTGTVNTGGSFALAQYPSTSNTAVSPAQVFLDALSGQNMTVGTGSGNGSIKSATIGGSRYAVLFQTGGGNNGIANATANGQTVVADPSYSGTEQYTASNAPYASAYHLQDQRNGILGNFFHNSGFTTNNFGVNASAYTTCLTDGQSGGSTTGSWTRYCNDADASDYTPGWTLNSNRWYSTSIGGFHYSVNGSGIAEIIALNLLKYGIGDAATLYTVVNCPGGYVTGSDEGCKALAVSSNEISGFPTGTCLVGCTVGSTQIHLTPVVGNGQQWGTGRYTRDTSQNAIFTPITTYNTSAFGGSSDSVTIPGATITAFQITSNVVTITAVNTLKIGNPVYITGLSTGTYLNATQFTVASASSSQFTFAFTHADVGLTSDSGTAGLPISNAWGTLSGDCSAALVHNNAPPFTTSSTCNFIVVGGAGLSCSTTSTVTGTCPSSPQPPLICFKQSQHECVAPTAINFVSGSTWAVTMPLRGVVHQNTTYWMQGGLAGNGVAFPYYDQVTGGQTLTYPFDVIGCTTSTLCEMQSWGTNGSGILPFSAYPGWSGGGPTTPASANLATLSSNGTTVSGTYVSAGSTLVLTQFNKGTILIAGASDTALNIPCTNVIFLPNSLFFTCTGAGLTSQHASATATATLSNAAGIAVNIARIEPMAQVLDVQPEGISITAWSINTNVVTFTANNWLTVGGGQTVTISGFATSTFLNGTYTTISATSTTFTVALTHANGSATEAGLFAINPSIPDSTESLEANVIQTAPGDTFEEMHHEAAHITGMSLITSVNNPYNQYVGINATSQGAGIQGGSYLTLGSAPQDAFYKGLGGGLAPPDGANIAGSYHNFLTTAEGPQSGASLFSISFTAAQSNDPYYNFSPIPTASYTPFIGKFSLIESGLLQLAGGEIILSGPITNQPVFKDNAYFQALGTAPTATVTCQAFGGQGSGTGLADSTTFAYYIQAKNNAGTSIHGVEATCTTGVSSNNNSVKVVWTHVAGAVSYQVCGRTTGGELLMGATLTGYDNTTFIDNNSLTPAGACSTTDTTRPSVETAAFVGLQSTGAGEMRLRQPDSIGTTYFEDAPETGTGGRLVDKAAGATTIGDVATFSNVTGRIQDSGTLLTSLAPKASPALTGAPSAPTQAAGDTSTDIATDAFVYASTSKVNTCGTTTTCANTAQASPRIVHGNVALTAGSAVVGSMTPWTATTSFDCTGTDKTATAAVQIVNTSTTSITITGTGTDVVSYVCSGN